MKMLKFRVINNILDMDDFIPYDCMVSVQSDSTKFLYQYFIETNDKEIGDDLKIAGKNIVNDSSGVVIKELMFHKLCLLKFVHEYFAQNNIQFDEFNGLAPTRINEYKAYEYGTLWFWGFLISLINGSKTSLDIFNKSGFYKRFGNMISIVFKKYPVTTSSLLYEIDLHFPGNKFMDYANMDDADFDSDTQEGWNNEKADEFNSWLITWCNRATEHDKMRVRHWFEQKKSHKQIFAEINKVVGNADKFNSRLALFFERLLNNENLDYFYEKSGFSNKEDLYMAYLDKIEMFDDEAKHSFIKKYLLKV